MSRNKLVAPVLKWVGGKRQLMPSIEKLLPEIFSTYCEPFVGGGAVLFHLQPKNAVINDSNAELINVYTVIKNNVEELINDLKKHKNEAEYFYEIRSLDRTEQIDSLTNIEKASRIIFLNKTCFNGLYRVNSSGEFNSPFGRYINPNIVNEITLKTVSNYLNNNNITILNGDYEEAVNRLKKNSFIYFDPPYHPVSESSSFTGYTQSGFNSSDQIRLKKVCDKLNSKGIRFLLSNSATKFIEDLYSEYSITYIKANRAINSNGEKRGEVAEVLIKNYD